jgi:homoserine kinase
MGHRTKMKKAKNIILKIPGSTSNLGPGFDTLGLAINLFLHIKAEPSDKLYITVSGEGEKEIEKASKNLVYQSYKKYFQCINEEILPVKLSLKNEIPLKKGLGSSGAAIVGGLLLAREMAKKKISDNELLSIATSIEGHPDNVTPSLFGGLIASCLLKDKVIFSKINLSKQIKLIAVIPEINVSTKKARAILPKRVSFKDAVFNVQRVALLVNSFYVSDFDNMKYYFSDKLHQTYRKIFVPGFDDALKIGVKKGALGVYLSGSGPTIIAFYKDNGKVIAESIAEIFKKKNIACKIINLKPVLKTTFIQYKN